MENNKPLLVNTDHFIGKNVLVTGGLGFIGSNLVHQLVGLGAHVTILDGLIEGHGGNMFNIQSVEDKVRVIIGDLRDQEVINKTVTGKDYIFHLAGQNDHVLSLSDPFPDIDINIKGTAILLEACKKFNKRAKLIYTGTRGEYGSAVTLPVSEKDPINPKGIYELSSLTAQKLFKIYNDNHGIQSITLRLTNVYGERAQMQHHRFGVANWFIRVALDDGTIKVFGDGALKRDFLYIDDALEAILMCSLCEEAYGEVFNVGRDEPDTFLELAKNVVEISQSGKWEFAPFSPERAAQEPGDFYSDISKIQSIVGWKPKTSLKEGLAKTIAFYKENKPQYWEVYERSVF